MDKITHFEIPVDSENPDKSIDFYKKTFNWEVNKWDGPMPYWMVHTVAVDEQFMPKESGAINGGFTTKEDIKQPTVVVTVDSLDDSLQKIKDNGGEVVMERVTVGDMGYYARFKDPEGNIIGIWESIKKDDSKPEEDQTSN